MRAKSRAKKFIKKKEEQEPHPDVGEQHGEGEENAWDDSEHIWIDPDTGEKWNTLQDADGNWYYQNKVTGETRWA